MLDSGQISGQVDNKSTLLSAFGYAFGFGGWERQIREKKRWVAVFYPPFIFCYILWLLREKNLICVSSSPFVLCMSESYWVYMGYWWNFLAVSELNIGLRRTSINPCALMVCKFGEDGREMVYFCWLWYNLSRGGDHYEYREFGEFDLVPVIRVKKRWVAVFYPPFVPSFILMVMVVLHHRFFPHLLLTNGDGDGSSFKHSPMWHSCGLSVEITLECPSPTFFLTGHVVHNLHWSLIHLR
ncbi:hypothetical protein DVH24_030950 [Malus domestica]|uniref:Transmembrane protein n=1 Tax=Malus domestica TaxID=3750 RepID=A0A498HH13_MALDO|nr:hypothetical protein DVH24_030950 [Malus domestica]